MDQAEYNLSLTLLYILCGFLSPGLSVEDRLKFSRQIQRRPKGESELVDEWMRSEIKRNNAQALKDEVVAEYLRYLLFSAVLLLIKIVINQLGSCSFASDASELFIWLIISITNHVVVRSSGKNEVRTCWLVGWIQKFRIGSISKIYSLVVEPTTHIDNFTRSVWCHPQALWAPKAVPSLFDDANSPVKYT